MAELSEHLVACECGEQLIAEEPARNSRIWTQCERCGEQWTVLYRDGYFTRLSGWRDYFERFLGDRDREVSASFTSELTDEARRELAPLVEHAIQQRKARIRAEVEAMEWPEFI